MTKGSRDSSVVRAPDLWLKGHNHGFEFLQEWQENFLLQGKLSVVLFQYSFHACVTAVKDPGHSAKSAGSRLQLNMHVPYVYIYGFVWSDMGHGCMVYTQSAKTAAVNVAPAMSVL